MGIKRTSEFRAEAVRIALTSGLAQQQINQIRRFNSNPQTPDSVIAQEKCDNCATIK